MFSAAVQTCVRDSSLPSPCRVRLQPTALYNQTIDPHKSVGYHVVLHRRTSSIQTFKPVTGARDTSRDTCGRLDWEAPLEHAVGCRVSATTRTDRLPWRWQMPENLKEHRSRCLDVSITDDIISISSLWGSQLSVNP